jgi:hypothetical protein
MAFVLPIALVLGVCAGWIDLHSEEVQPTVLVLVVAAGSLGFFAPRLAALSGLLVGIGVPLAHLYARIVGYALPYPMHAYVESFIALIPAVLAAGIGAAIRRVLPPGVESR